MREFWDSCASDPDRWVCGEWDTTDATVDLILAHMPSTGVVLDLGCGVGRLAYGVAQRSKLEVVAVDISSRMIAQAPRHEQITYMVNDGVSVPPGAFDGAWSVLVFQHLPEEYVRDYLIGLGGALRPGAPGLIQFIHGNYHEGYDHRYSLHHMLRWAEEAGLQVRDYAANLIQEGWQWLSVKGAER